MSLPTQAPTTFFAGDTVKWLVSAPDYAPNGGWSLTVDFTNASNNYKVTGSDHGDGRHLVTVAASLSAGFAPGDYHLVVAAVKSGERYTVEAASLVIKPNLSSLADGRSHVKKTLDALESWIESRNQGVAEYSVAGRAMKYWPLPDLIVLLDKYRAQWRAEQDAARMSNGRRPRRRLLTRMQG